MSAELAGAVGFAAVLALVLLRVPVAVAMGLVGIVGTAALQGRTVVEFVLGRAPFDAVSPVSLAVIPLFLAMGVLSGIGGLSSALYAVARAWLGHLRGGLAIATIGACAAFGAICGSSIATAATMGRIAIPEMRRLGYADPLAAASVAAGGTLGVMIPPSILLVIYGLLTEQSIGKLFAAGVLPGLLGMAFYMLAARWASRRALVADLPLVPARERLRVLGQAWGVLALFAAVLGGLYFGWFTATEAAAVGAIGALLMAVARRKLPAAQALPAMQEVAQTTAAIFAILMGGALFNYFIDAAGTGEAVVRWVQTAGLDRYAVLLLLLVMYLVLGCLMDSLSMILLTIGTVFPLVRSLGFDPIWFGVLLVTAAEIGMITPPVGMNLFVLQSVVPGLNYRDVVAGIFPFVAMDIARLAVLILVPGLALWLPAGMRS